MPRPRRQRLGSHLRHAFALPLIGALWACGEAETVADTPDAAPAPLCEPGTQACVCSTSDACDDGLLCNAGRCLSTAGGHDPEDPVRPGPRPPQGPPTPPAPPNISDAGGDANAAEAGPAAADASADAAPPSDAVPPSDAAPPVDAASDANP